MNEIELQRKWFAFAQLQPKLILSSGKVAKIVDPGQFNTSESGPDFLNCKIRIENIIWVGAIEIHLKASDWRRHKHQHDKVYEGVILHVVAELDCLIDLNGEAMEHFLLKPFPLLDGLVKKNSRNYGNFQAIICGNLISEVPAHKFEIEKYHSLTRKWIRKLQEHELNGRTDKIQVFYELLASSFGKKVNHDCFWVLAKYLPIRFLRQFNARTIELLLLSAAGFIPNYESDAEKKEQDYLMNFHAVFIMNQEAWKKKGLRPASFPEKKIKELALLLAKIDWYQVENESKEIQIESFLSEFSNKIDDLKEEMKLSIRINTLLPFIFWVENGLQPSPFLINFTKSLAPEKNRFITFFKTLGFKVENAFDSQALLSLYRDKCAFKKCLNCAIGTELMRQ